MGLKDWIEAPAASVVPAARSKLNLLRGAAARLTTPLLPDDYLHLANPLWSARELRGQIVEVRPETTDSATIVIKPGWGFDFNYQPGQYIGIGLHIDGRWHWRSYSLTSPPNWENKRISIAVKAMPEAFSRATSSAGPCRREPSFDWPRLRATSRCRIRHRRRSCSSPPAVASLRSWACCGR